MGGMFAHGGELGGEEKQKGGDLMCVVRCVLKNQSKRCDVFRERIGVEKLEMMFTCGTGVLSKEKNKLCAWSAVRTWTGTKKTLTEQNVRHGGDQINIQSFHVCWRGSGASKIKTKCSYAAVENAGRRKFPNQKLMCFSWTSV